MAATIECACCDKKHDMVDIRRGKSGNLQNYPVCYEHAGVTNNVFWESFWKKNNAMVGQVTQRQRENGDKSTINLEKLNSVFKRWIK